MITVYSPQYERLGTIKQYTSAQWTKKFYDTGSFEIHIPNAAEGLIHLEMYNVIHANDNWGYILKRQWNEKEVVIYGYDLCGLLEYKAVTSVSAGGFPPYSVYSIMSYIAGTNLISSIPKEDFKEYEFDTEQTGIAIAANLLRVVAESEGMGYDLYVSENGITGEIKKGEDKTYLVFSADRNNIIDFKYEDDYYKNANVCVYIRDNGSDSVAEYYNPNNVGVGTNRQEMIYNESIRPEEETAEDLNTGDEVPKYMYKNINISKVITFTPAQYVYKQDYFLGDYVTAKVDVFGKTLYETKQITEVTEVFESAKHEIKLTLGKAKNNYIRVLKNKGVI